MSAEAINDIAAAIVFVLVLAIWLRAIDLWMAVLHAV